MPVESFYVSQLFCGKRIDRIDVVSFVIELPNIKNPGEWSAKYKDRLFQAKEIATSYQETSKMLQYLHKSSKKNRYHWEIFKAINDFQIVASSLLIAIEQVDSKDKKIRSSGLENVKKSLLDFDTTWENLQSVYAKTRFISYPENYVQDRWYHYASQREDLTWMVQVEELFFPIVKDWLKNIDN